MTGNRRAANYEVAPALDTVDLGLKRFVPGPQNEEPGNIGTATLIFDYGLLGGAGGPEPPVLPVLPVEPVVPELELLPDFVPFAITPTKTPARTSNRKLLPPSFLPDPRFGIDVTLVFELKPGDSELTILPAAFSIARASTADSSSAAPLEAELPETVMVLIGSGYVGEYTWTVAVT